MKLHLESSRWVFRGQNLSLKKWEVSVFSGCFKIAVYSLAGCPDCVVHKKSLITP